MKKIVLFTVFSFLFSFAVFVGNYASAAVTITTLATSDISSDSFSGDSISVPNIIITEGAIEEIAVGTHVWTTPTGYIFDTTSVPNVAYTNGLAGDATATMTDTTLTITTTSTSTPAGVMTVGSNTPIKVKMLSDYCPLISSGDLTHTSGTITGVTNSSTSFGTWTQVQGTTSICGGSSKDSVAPKTTILYPSNGVKIEEGDNYTITGTSSDTGGGSMQRVEISFDGGLSWSTVEPTTPASNNGFNWKYEWVNPKVGFYNIRTRGVDWTGNLELPSKGIEVVVEAPVHKVVKEVVITISEVAENKQNITTTKPEVISKKSKSSVVLVRAQDDQKVYVVYNNKKRHIPNVGTFNSYGYSWKNVQVESPSVVNSYKTINLIRKLGDDKVYIVKNNKKNWIKTAKEFINLGYNWDDIADVNSAEFKSYSEE